MADEDVVHTAAGGGHAAGSQATEPSSHPHVNYFLVFAALCVLTALSVVADVIDIQNPAVLIVVVLAIAAAKALFVMMYFMHLKFEGRWKYVLLAPTLILAVGIPLALLPDIGVHYYTVRVPQAEAAASGAHHAAGGAEADSDEAAANEAHGH